MFAPSTRELSVLAYQVVQAVEATFAAPPRFKKNVALALAHGLMVEGGQKPWERSEIECALQHAQQALGLAWGSEVG